MAASVTLMTLAYVVPLGVGAAADPHWHCWKVRRLRPSGRPHVHCVSPPRRRSSTRLLSVLLDTAGRVALARGAAHRRPLSGRVGAALRAGEQLGPLCLRAARGLLPAARDGPGDLAAISPQPPATSSAYVVCGGRSSHPTRTRTRTRTQVGLAPTIFGKRSQTFHTPVNAILIQVFIIALLVGLDFDGIMCPRPP